MAEILRFVLVDLGDQEQDYEYDTYQEAVTDARKYGLAVVQRTYIYDDHELVWTPDGTDIWPPHDTPFEEEA